MRARSYSADIRWCSFLHWFQVKATGVFDFTNNLFPIIQWTNHHDKCQEL